MNAKDYPEDFPDKLDYALHTLSPTQRAAFESWASKQEREDAEADAAALSEVFDTSLTPLEPSVELKARVMAQRIPPMRGLSGGGSGLRGCSLRLA